VTFGFGNQHSIQLSYGRTADNTAGDSTLQIGALPEVEHLNPELGVGGRHIPASSASAGRQKSLVIGVACSSRDVVLALDS
jgi:hypothetical protein